MGVQVLAIAVWLGSIALYGAAFFFPEVHRRHDFFWSGVGAFYGLVLWFSAAQTSPTELLGHLASVVLLGWLGWQTLTLRRKRIPLDLQTPLTPDSWPTFGRQLQQSALNLLKATPLGRWLPEAEAERRPGDAAIAISEIRVSSLKDVDYEFVDELEPVSPRSTSAKADPAKMEGRVPKPVVAESASSPAPASIRAKRPSRFAERSLRESLVPPPSPVPPPIAPKQKPATLGGRLAGLKAWVGDVVKAKTTPKPKRAVIEIPPRPSPLAKNKAQPAAKTDSPTEDRPDPAQPSGTPPGITIVDTEAIESFDQPDEGDSRRDTRSESGSVSGMPQAIRSANRDEVAASEDSSSSVTEAITDAPTGSASQAAEVWTDAEDTNWDDDENWADS